jgi:uncharacterized membrane protein YdbT with pleckstrin-like domain
MVSTCVTLAIPANHETTARRYCCLVGYPQRFLNDDESVAVDLHPHWSHFFRPVAALVAAIFLGVVTPIVFDAGSWGRTIFGWIALAAIAAGSVWTVARYISWVTSHFVVTNHRIIYRTGWLRKHGIDIPLDRVNNVVISQSLTERIIGAGDLLIESAGESGQQRFSDIRAPMRVQNQIYAQIQIEKQSHRRSETPVAPGTDIASQLERLEGLLERGALTREEFEFQKYRLLTE